jgi:hypothetical protein
VMMRVSPSPPQSLLLPTQILPPQGELIRGSRRQFSTSHSLPKSLRDWGQLGETPVDSRGLEWTRNRQHVKTLRRYPDVAHAVAESAHAHSNPTPATNLRAWEYRTSRPLLLQSPFRRRPIESRPTFSIPSPYQHSRNPPNAEPRPAFERRSCRVSNQSA